MILRFLLAPALLLLHTSFLSLPSRAQADRGAPEISSTDFKTPLLDIFYFDDSDILLGLDDTEGVVHRSTDAGKTWKVLDSNGLADVRTLVQHPIDPTRAYAIGIQHSSWITTDRGETWRKFETDASPHQVTPPLAFHGRDPKKVIFHGQSCGGLECKEMAYYTENDFETISLLREDSLRCLWAVSTPQYGIGIEADISSRIFCMVRGLFSSWATDNRILMSDDHFKTEAEAMLAGPRSVSGVINMAPVKQYFVVAARAEGTDELALFVTHDSTHWNRAEFGDQKVFEEAYTVLESTDYSLQVDVKGKGDMGTFFTSNSNGTYFTKKIEHTNRGPDGFVDFEKVTGIQGIVLVNVVENWSENGGRPSPKHVTSQISFDDGRTFEDLKVGADRLHLHSVTDPNNVGKIFSSPAPGIVMGVGNTGDMLRDYKDGDLYVSDDAGLTWRPALKGPHKYEFGDQGAIVVAIKDDNEAEHIEYSVNHGKDWTKADLGVKIDPKMLTTVPDSTSLKFLLQAAQGGKWLTMTVDFDGLHERRCEDNDFEKWPARVGEDGKPSCLMGHKQFYRRRKADADCFVAEEFKDPQPETERCKCTKQDFECDSNYVRSEDGASCLPARPLEPPQADCKDPKGSFRGSSGFRIIPGNDCETDGGEDLEKQIDRPCSETSPPPSTGHVTHEQTPFEVEQFGEWHYLERAETNSGDDESIVMRLGDGKVFLTKDHGKQWQEILRDEKIKSVSPHPYFNDAIYFLTEGKEVFYSLERGDNIQKLEAPQPPHPHLQTLRFYKHHKDSLLWTGVGDYGEERCGDAYYTTNRHEWSLLRKAVRKCEFIERDDREYEQKDRYLVFCEQYERENPKKPLQLLSSTDWFMEKTIHFEDILEFATMSEFIIVAAKSEDRQSVKVDASVDGRIFAPAEFPPNFKVKHEREYTVLKSSTHAIFLHVTVNNVRDQEYGTIIKSNSNGTFYSMSVRNVNRDSDGYVDFEKMQGLEGVALVNVVDNVDEVEKGEPKTLKSMITHNDGADWSLIPPPGHDSNGNSLGCVANLADDKCSLHFHSYTERFDKKATFSSPSAVGLMLAVGNVGEHLLPREGDDTHTFITRDGGITWTAIRKGSYLWEYGDQGSIILICERLKATKVIHYSLDEGETWEEYHFSDAEMEIQQITTTPSDNSRNFLLWGKEKGTSHVSTVNIDFTGLPQRQRACVLQDLAPEDDDYYLWEPRHPLQRDNCLFGHVAQYHRKRLDRDCYNGFKTEGLHQFARHCPCTRQDFECDYNYERLGDGTCSLVAGLQPADSAAICRENSSVVEYNVPTGYRRIPLTTCRGGVEIDQLGTRPCPGHEDDYRQRHGLGGAALFFSLVVPFVAAGGMGYYAWTNWRHKLSGFGQIRLGEVGGISSFPSRDSPFIAVPVAIIAAALAVAQATPLLLSSLWKNARGYVPLGSGRSGGWMSRSNAPYTSRGAFSARRQDYSHVVADEDELLGNDLDEGDDV